jgi:hypothetical protein
MVWLKHNLALLNAGLAITGRLALAQSASVIFTLGLVALAVGSGLYDAPLALIVPGAILVGLTTAMHLIEFCRG